MLRMTCTAATLLAAMTAAASAQSLPDAWIKWRAEHTSMIQTISEGIQFWISYRDQVCPAQFDNEKKTDCKARVSTMIDRLEWQKSLLAVMVEGLNKLPNNESTKFASIANPLYQQTNALSAVFGRETLTLYPRR